MTLRALATATSTLKTVASCIRCRPNTVPSRSVTALVILVGESGGRRITARVTLAVATAWLMIFVTSLCDRDDPAVGPTRSPSGGNPPFSGPNVYVPVVVPGPMPSGGVVWFTKGRAIPPRRTTPGGGTCAGLGG